MGCVQGWVKEYNKKRWIQYLMESIIRPVLEQFHSVYGVSQFANKKRTTSACRSLYR